MIDLKEDALKTRSGWIIILILLFIPLTIWFLHAPIQYRFLGYYSSLTSLGQIAALSGMVLFSITLILSIRIEFYEDWFGGMNNVYIVHHLLGGISFILLMLHPLFLALSYTLISLENAAKFLLPGSNTALNFGISALMFMMSLLIITFFIDLPYQIWLLTHKFLGFAFFLGSIHAFLIESDISRILLLRIYMLTIIIMGLVSYVFRTLLGRILIKRHLYIVREVNKLNKEVNEIVLEPIKGKSIHYIPGQFVFISFRSKGFEETHPFSLSSSFSENIKLTVKSLGDYSLKLSRLTPNTEALIEGPYGRFSYLFTKNKKQIWIAGGIGITPFVSMARSLKNSENLIDLYYSVSNENEIIYISEFQNILAQQPNFRVFTWVTAQQGRLTAEIIANNSGDILNKEIFLCGPPAMMYSLRNQFRKLHVSKTYIHTEEFQMS